MDVTDLLDLCRQRSLRLTSAESCTGGMVGAALTAIPGSSDVYERGFITYSNAAKRELLGVTQMALDQFGAVSEQVADQMASGALHHSHADLAVSITGIAGPGGSDHKPEGRVCFGLAWKIDEAITAQTETLEFGPLGRDQVRQAATTHALQILHHAAQNLSQNKG